MQIEVSKVDLKNDLPFGLLLLADETIEAIEKYIYDCDVYVAKKRDESEGFAVFALYKIDNSSIEIKNIAVAATVQNNGIGSFLISEIKRIAKAANYENIIVGTPDSSARPINFYQKNGFKKYDLKKDFFIKNYPSPILEDGVMLKDMVMLRLRI